MACLIIILIACIVLDVCMTIDAINSKDFSKTGLAVIAGSLCVPGLIECINSLIKEYKTK